MPANIIPTEARDGGRRSDRAVGDPRRLSDPEYRRKLSGPGLTAFFEIANRWEMSAAEQQTLLGSPPRSTFFSWKKGAPVTLSRDTLERISHILGIYKDLHILFPSAEIADKWIRMPNDEPLFGKRPVAEFILSGSIAELITVHRYLDAQRSGWA